MDFLTFWKGFGIEDLGNWLSFIVITAISFVTGLVIAYIVLKTLHWFGARKDRHMNGIMRKNLRLPLFVFFPLTSTYLSTMAFEPQLLDIQIVDAVIKVLFVLCLISVTLGVIKTVSLYVQNHFDISNEDNLRARAVHTQITVIRRIAGFIVIVIGLSSFFLLFDELRSIGVSLIASAGIAGIALGFAAQKTLGNLLAGIQIAFAQPIRVDDAVYVEGEWGWIEEITLTYVVIKIWDLRRLVLPISYFIEKPFQNWTKTSSTIIGSVFLYTDYTMPVDALREKFENILANNPNWNKQVQVVQVTDSKPETMEIRMLMSAKNSPTAWDLRCEVREEMVKFIQENYPHALPKTRAVLRQEVSGGDQEKSL
jgi:small-conductance mechanosensitive channel